MLDKAKTTKPVKKDKKDVKNVENENWVSPLIAYGIIFGVLAIALVIGLFAIL
jgi:hypothetical protein